MAKRPPSVIKMAQKRRQKIRDIYLVGTPASRNFRDDRFIPPANFVAQSSDGHATPRSRSNLHHSAGFSVGTPGRLVFDLCCQLQQSPGQFEVLFPQIKKACMVLAEAAPSFGPLILNLGYHLSRFDYVAAVERAGVLMQYEDAVLEARGQAALGRVFDELRNFGRYN